MLLLLYVAEPHVKKVKKYPLSDIEQNVWNKDINFIPTPKNVTQIPIMEAASNFGRWLKIAYHFRKSKFKDHSEYFIDKSKLDTPLPPDKSIPSDILDTIQNTNTDLTNREVPKQPQNLSNAELTALKHLRSNPFIVIKPAK